MGFGKDYDVSWCEFPLALCYASPQDHKTSSFAQELECLIGSASVAGEVLPAHHGGRVWGVSVGSGKRERRLIVLVIGICMLLIAACIPLWRGNMVTSGLV